MSGRLSDPAVVAAAVAFLGAVAVLAWPTRSRRRRRARNGRIKRAFAWFPPPPSHECGLEDLLDRPPPDWGPGPPEDLSGQDAVAPLRDALRRREDGHA